MKTAFKLILLLALLVYLCFAFTRFSNTGSDATCEGVHVIVADSTHAGFITADEVLKILDEAHIDPVGKPMKDIVSKAIEDTLLKNSFVREATCYKTPANKVNILVEQRLPLMRIMADNGDDYYLDENGFAMDAQGYAANLVVATGDFDRDFARTIWSKLDASCATTPFGTTKLNKSTSIRTSPSTSSPAWAITWSIWATPTAFRSRCATSRRSIRRPCRRWGGTNTKK